MRIVAGKYRHRLIVYPENNPNIRPTKDMVREGIFSALGDISNKKVLDLFAGSGAMGIEALSRGADMCYFVDENDLAIKAIERNMLALNIKNGQIMHLDYLKALEYFISKKEVFDIIILDPPYASGYYNNAIEMVYLNHLVSDDGIIVVESVGNISYDGFDFIKCKRYHYGKTYVDLLRRLK